MGGAILSLDLTQAFDRVDRSALVAALRRLWVAISMTILHELGGALSGPHCRGTTSADDALCAFMRFPDTSPRCFR